MVFGRSKTQPLKRPRRWPPAHRFGVFAMTMTKHIRRGLAAAALLGVTAAAAGGAFAQTSGGGNPAAGTGALDWLLAHFGLIAIVAIVVVFLVSGIPDLLRLSFRRLWAI